MIEQLAWDSEFFGIKIGRVDLDGASDEALAAAEIDARDLGIECLYGMLDPSRGDAGQMAQMYGWRLVEVAITFSRPATPFMPRPSESRARRGTVEDVPKLADAIDVLVPWSRFAVDPRFGPEAARRMFEAWARRAAESDDRMLAVSEDASGVTGFSTHVRAPVPRVDLMGVTARGSGAAWALMQQLIDWAGGGAVEAGPCAARNIAPLRFLEHCGFGVARTHYLFHRWLDEGRAVR